jgi:predicted nuclease with TOPRIM domain
MDVEKELVEIKIVVRLLEEKLDGLKTLAAQIHELRQEKISLAEDLHRLQGKFEQSEKRFDDLKERVIHLESVRMNTPLKSLQGDPIRRKSPGPPSPQP